MEWYEELLDLCDRDMQIWLLYLAAYPHRVGIGKTSDYNTQRGPLEAWAKRNGIKDFDVRTGYKRLTRREFSTPRGTMTLLLEDKPDLLRLTKAAMGVLQYLAPATELHLRILKKVGATTNEIEKWFPVPAKPGAPVQLSTISPRQATEPYTIRVDALFQCGRCNAAVAHSYDVLWRNEEWNQVTARCGSCGTIWGHFKGHPYLQPQPMNG